MFGHMFSYVDLFAGIGGFHAALSAAGGVCQYAVEVDPAASRVYERNWLLDPLGDITAATKKPEVHIPSHDVLAAGFPCQPFSKSGRQLGMEETRGTLFWHIAEILRLRRPTVVLLENVRNIAGPRHRHEWRTIIATLRELGYVVADEPAILSPHWLPYARGGRPQVRERVFITATYAPTYAATLRPSPVVNSNDLIDGFDPKSWAIDEFLDPAASQATRLTDTERHWIDSWDEFVQTMRKRRNGQYLPGFPIWADCWADFDRSIPSNTPEWKRSHLERNYGFYAEHRRFIDGWAKECELFSDRFPPSRRKLEWQAQETRSLWDTLIHLRPSGIRAKKPNYAPALVAITQTSIYGPQKRRLSVRETARLQGFPDWFSFGDQKDALSYKQLGNAVNVGAVWHVFREHVLRDASLLAASEAGQRLLKTVRQMPKSPDTVLAELNLHPVTSPAIIV